MTEAQRDDLIVQLSIYTPSRIREIVAEYQQRPKSDDCNYPFYEFLKEKLEEENDHLISNLQESLKRVKLFSGLLPICASCKSIKDDKGIWSEVEKYIANHSEATCSHGICPECAERLYPELYSEIKRGRPETAISHKDDD